MTPAQRAKAEAKAKADGLDWIELDGQVLTMRPSLDWHTDMVEALGVFQYEPWARGCLTPESYVAWRTIRPTVRQAKAAIDGWNARTGQDMGESAAS